MLKTHMTSPDSPDSAAQATLNVARHAALAAVVLSLGLVGAKGWAWLAGGSAALLASLVDSMIDALISATNYLAIMYARRPADDDHRYGHGKMEGIAALVQAAFIAGSCAFVLLEAVRRLSNPEAVGAVGLGVWVLVAATIFTIALSQYQKHAARQSRSLAIEADAAHYASDVAVNIGVIASLIAGKALGWLWLDPLVAVLVAAWLLYSAWGIGAKAVDMLLDREIDEGTRDEILTIIRFCPGVDDVHDLRTRRSGDKTLVSFDIEVDPSLSLLDAHDIARNVEEKILETIPQAEIMIHIDPRGDVTDSRHKKIKAYHAR